MPLINTNNFTTDYIYSLPDGERAELIDGTIYSMAPPSTLHQDLLMHISAAIHNYIQKNNGSCRVYPAPFAVFLNSDDKTYIEPDISVVCNKSKINDKGCNGAPDWIIEIVSPSSTRMDYFIKLFKYRSAGVREYWIVNPMKKTIQTYLFEGEEDSNQYSFDDTVKVQIYRDLTINITQLLK